MRFRTSEGTSRQALLVLGVLAGAAYTIYGHPADPSERPAAETIPEKATAPQ